MSSPSGSLEVWEDKTPPEITDGKPMTEDKFWLIIQALHDVSESKKVRANTLRLWLSKIPVEDAVKFGYLFPFFCGKARTNKMWAAAYLMNSGCGDDGFVYFLSWLVGEGKETYFQALKNPDTLATYDKNCVFSFEDLAYAAEHFFNEETKEYTHVDYEMQKKKYAHLITSKMDVDNGEYDIENPDYEDFPNLFQKYDPNWEDKRDHIQPIFAHREGNSFVLVGICDGEDERDPTPEEHLKYPDYTA